MTKITMTEDLAYAASQDAGNRSMRNNGRTTWSREDWDVACATFARLWPNLTDDNEFDNEENWHNGTMRDGMRRARRERP